MDPVTIGLAVGAVGAAAAASSASKANSNARRTSRAATAQADANKALTKIEFTERQRKLAETFSQYNKTLGASAGIRGVGDTSSTIALQRASLASALRDESMLEAGQTSTTSAIDAQALNIHNQSISQMQNPFMSGITGGLGGLQSGLSLGDSLEKAGWIK
jgi:hypothetical protein